MSTEYAQSGVDEFDRAVTYGNYRHDMFFDRRNPRVAPLPVTPPPAASFHAGDRCDCPHCTSMRWFAQSPKCRFWRCFCETCDGTRTWLDFSKPGPLRRRPCQLCATMWRQDVAWFRFALQHPSAAARILRDEAAARSRVRLCGPITVSVSDSHTDYTATQLFWWARMNELHAAHHRFMLDAIAPTVAGGVDAVARAAQEFHDLAAAYREHGRRQLIAQDPTVLGEGEQS